jgi:hypothetical protein
MLHVPGRNLGFRGSLYFEIVAVVDQRPKG